MKQLQSAKDYSGSVYGGLGQLLYAYCQAQNIEISAQLQRVQNQERFAFSIWSELLNKIAAQVSTPTLGLDIAAHIEPKHLGIIAYIAMSCDTLAEALARYHDFHRLIYDGRPLYVEIHGDHLHIRWAELPRFLATQITDEIAIAILVQFLKHFLDLNEISLHQINFSQSPPKSLKPYEQYFRCKVKFAQAHAELILPYSVLSKPIRQADQTLQQLLMQQAQALLNKLPHSNQLDERLQQSILMGLQRSNYQIESIAQQLNMSVRQLQRHLQLQNTTYQQRVQRVRQMLALQYLKDPHLSLHEIALLLSYSEQSAFQRAFKQWMACTPQQWRLQLKTKPSASTSPNTAHIL